MHQVARNRREFEDRIRARFRSRDPGQFVEHRVREAARADAVYLLAKDDVECPVVIPLMSQSENKPAWEFWPVLRHDLTHQLVTTYLFHERLVLFIGDRRFS